MSQITKTGIINVDTKKVIEYISDVKNHPAFIESLKSIGNINGDSKQPGTIWDWTFMMGGVLLTGKSETVTYQEGTVFSYKTNGGIESLFTYNATPDGAGSKVTISIDYTIPESVIARIMDKAVIEKINEEQGEKAIENLKAILEG